MACNSLTALTSDNCNITVGGGSALYLIAYSDTVSGATSLDHYTITDDVISAINLAPSKKFVSIGTLKDTLGLNETLTTDATKNVAYYTQTLPFSVALSVDERSFTKSLLNNPVIAIWKSKTGKYFVAGVDGHLTMTANERNLGTAVGDGNVTTVTLTGISHEMIVEIPETLVKTYTTE